MSSPAERNFRLNAGLWVTSYAGTLFSHVELTKAVQLNVFPSEQRCANFLKDSIDNLTRGGARELLATAVNGGLQLVAGQSERLAALSPIGARKLFCFHNGRAKWLTQ